MIQLYGKQYGKSSAERLASSGGMDFIKKYRNDYISSRKNENKLAISKIKISGK